MLKFEDQSLKRELDRLAPPSRVAFAASCTQRLASVYHDFVARVGLVERVEVFDDALNYVWTHVLTTPEESTIARLLAKVMALIPDEDAAG